MPLSPEEMLKRAVDFEISQNPGLVPHEWMDFDEWAYLNGKEDHIEDHSVTAEGEYIPGSKDLYEGAMRVFEDPGDAFDAQYAF